MGISHQTLGVTGGRRRSPLSDSGFCGPAPGTKSLGALTKPVQRLSHAPSQTWTSILLLRSPDMSPLCQPSCITQTGGLYVSSATAVTTRMRQGGSHRNPGPGTRSCCLRTLTLCQVTSRPPLPATAALDKPSNIANVRIPYTDGLRTVGLPGVADEYSLGAGTSHCPGLARSVWSRSAQYSVPEFDIWALDCVDPGKHS